MFLKKIKLVAVSLFLMAGFNNSLMAQSSVDEVEKLTAIGKLWSTVRVHHPWAGADPELWDKALVDALPAIRAADDQASFANAVESMLSALNDDVTKVNVPPKNPSAPPANIISDKVKPELQWLNDQTAYLDLRRWISILNGAGGLNNIHAPVLTEIFNEALKAKQVVIDIRRAKNDRQGVAFDPGSFFMPNILQRELPLIMPKDMSYPARANRQHYGHRNEGITSTVYYSGTYVVDGMRVKAQSPDAERELIIISNDEAAESTFGILMGLKASGAAKIIHEGSKVISDPLAAGNVVPLPYGIMAQVRTSYAIGEDKSTALIPNTHYAEGKLTSNKDIMKAVKKLSKAKTAKSQNMIPPYHISTTEPRYADMASPDLGYRLVALFKFWSAIEYYFPYKDLLDEPWEDALKTVLPDFIAADTAEKYVLAIARLGVLTQDSHTSISSAKLSELRGLASVPVLVQKFEGKPVVLDVAPDYTPLSGEIAIGDVIVSVDGKPTSERIAFLESFTPGSTPHALNRNTHLALLSGAPDTIVTAEVMGADQKIRQVKMKREHGGMGRADLYGAGKLLPEAKMLDGKIGYLDPTRLQGWTLEKGLKTVEGAENYIIDYRGYPNVIVMSVLQHLGQFTGEAARVTTKVIRPSGPGTRLEEENIQPVSISSPNKFEGKVVVLVNAWAQSATEHSILTMKGALGDNMYLIGSNSAGANGTITYTYLPGNITVSFTGQAISWPDGSQLQRLGTVPDLYLEPTIEGLRNGRDEHLEQALKWLSENK